MIEARQGNKRLAISGQLSVISYRPSFINGSSDMKGPMFVTPQ
jgi:hypothetical protein